LISLHTMSGMRWRAILRGRRVRLCTMRTITLSPSRGTKRRQHQHAVSNPEAGAEQLLTELARLATSTRGLAVCATPVLPAIAADAGTFFLLTRLVYNQRTLPIKGWECLQL
jgi:hypothetical protein